MPALLWWLAGGRGLLTGSHTTVVGLMDLDVAFQVACPTALRRTGVRSRPGEADLWTARPPSRLMSPPAAHPSAPSGPKACSAIPRRLCAIGF